MGLKEKNPVHNWKPQPFPKTLG